MAVHFDAQMSDDERRERLYAGDIFIFSATAGSRALIGLAQDVLERAFAPHDPQHIHEHLSPEAVAAVLATLKPQFIHHPACKTLIPAIMREHSIALDQLYFDVPRLRSAYPRDFLTSGIAYAFHPHRDMWYSAPFCQLNWWIPIYPLKPNNCMGFYPRYFHEGVANNSDIYNYYAWNTQNRATAAQHVKSDTRSQPKAQQELESVTVRFLPPPGGIILFSGAQLHETVPNEERVARYSIDFRTVHYADLVARRGAPNVDSRCTGTTIRDYLRASDLSRLPNDVVQLYDDGTEGHGNLLYFGDRLVNATRL
jgi:hypothetical protein